MRAFRVAYDGAGYHGFQRQPDVSTVEDALLQAMSHLEVIDVHGEPPAGYAAAGRTDAGVSALAQTVAFEAPPWLTPQAFSTALPDDVWVWADAPAPPAFHATHDAVSRTYEYHLRLGGSDGWTARADAALKALSGEHDYHNLTPDDAGTRRTVSASGRADPPYYVVTVTAGGFPRQLVRRLVSVAESVASGEAALAVVDRLLDGPPVDGPEGVPPAPPGALLLVDVDYPVLDFEPDQAALAAAVDTLSVARDTQATRVRMTDRVLDALQHAGEETD